MVKVKESFTTLGVFYYNWKLHLLGSMHRKNIYLRTNVKVESRVVYRLTKIELYII